MSVRSLIFSALFFVACDEPPLKLTPNTATTFAVIAMGGSQFEQPIHSGKCWSTEDGITRYEATATTSQEKLFRTAIVEYKTENHEVLEATVFVANATVDGEPYTVTMVTANRDVEGDQSSCRIEEKTVICNNARRIPWRDSHVQTANFRVPIICPER